MGEKEVQYLLYLSYGNKAVFQEINTRLNEQQNIDVTWQQWSLHGTNLLYKYGDPSSIPLRITVWTTLLRASQSS